MSTQPRALGALLAITTLAACRESEPITSPTRPATPNVALSSMGMTNAVPGEYIVLPTPPLATVDFWADMASRISMLDLRHFEAQLERYWAFGSLGHVRGAIVERHEQLVQMKDLSTCISYSLGGSYLATASERADGVPIVTLWTVR
jgi:hypothetical protein